MYGQAGAATAITKEALSRASTTVVPTMPAMDRIVESAEAALKRVHIVIAHIEGFSSRHLGERGADVAPAGVQSCRSGRIGAALDRLDDLHASLSTLESEIERLNEI